MSLAQIVKDNPAVSRKNFNGSPVPRNYINNFQNRFNAIGSQYSPNSANKKRKILENEEIKDSELNEESYTLVTKMNSKNHQNMNWRKRLNIVNGTAKKNDSESNSFAADIQLVAYGASKQCTSQNLLDFIRERGLNAVDCVLLTKHEEARSYSFKVSIRAEDFEKAKSADIWPYRIGIRLFKEFRNRQNLLNSGSDRNGMTNIDG